MKTHIKPETRPWPRRNAKSTKRERPILNVAERSDFSPLKLLPRSSLCALSVFLRQFDFGVQVKFFVTVLLLSSAASTLAGIHYVDLNSANAKPPYTSWAMAATNIQDAVDAAVAGDDVVVTNGIYATGGRVIVVSIVPLDNTINRLAVDKSVSLQSVNGPQFTIIDGGQSNRCVYLTNGATLSGFTLTNGNAGDRYGYGRRYGTGGGVYGGTLNNCTLSGNWAEYGGGAAGCTLNNCILIGNAAEDGGGAGSSTLNNCTLSNNSVASIGCCAGGDGGGAHNCTLNNCTLNDNVADGARVSGSGYSGGGGAFDSTLNNCTLTGNQAIGLFAAYAIGGGAFRCTLNNCIVYSNTAAYLQANYDSSSTLNHSCTTPLPTNGFGNITNAPLFVDLASGNLRLQSNSPCINSGLNALAPSGPDLDGNPRIVGGIVDIGAYEFQSPTSISPRLTILRSGENLVLTWPTNYTEFHLQSTTNLGSSAVWTIVSPPSVVIGGQYTVTNLISAPQQFYRLIQAPWFCSENGQCGPEYHCIDGICSHYVTGHGDGI